MQRSFAGICGFFAVILRLLRRKARKFCGFSPRKRGIPRFYGQNVTETAVLVPIILGVWGKNVKLEVAE
jgi:hypothetical protein